ncbi:hypothetical protein [uncultured Aquimarina sp.]|uniref:hypothetical protein n=1 Tax=uncultured Aquimarina sp. TaxID=575652 RepID=UPI002631C1CB|nr:hypothetical protein [uncultured Aquimarina sp.]
MKLKQLSLATLALSFIYDEAQVLHAERNALIDLFNTTNIYNWIDTTNWNTNESVIWTGVTVSNNSVVSLGFESDNLNASLRDLLNVKDIEFSNNEVFGRILSSFENLKTLFDIA